MYQLLSLLCLITIIWFLVWDYAEDTSKPSKGDSIAFPALLGGIVLAPLFALGAVLYAFAKAASYLPALLYGAAVLLQRFVEWLWREVKVLAAQLKDVLKRAYRNIGRSMRGRSFERFMQKMTAALRGVMRTVLQYAEHLKTALEELLDRTVRVIRIAVRDMFALLRGLRAFVTDRWSDSASRRHVSSRGVSYRTGFFTSLMRGARLLGMARRPSKTSEARDRKQSHRRWALSAFALLAFLGAKNRGSSSGKRQSYRNVATGSAGQRMHGRRFSEEPESRTASLFRAHYVRGNTTFERVELPRLPQNVLRNLRSVGWNVRKKIDRL